VTDPLGGEQVKQDRQQMPRLVAPGDPARLVFHPDAPGRSEIECVGQFVGPRTGCGDEARAGDIADGAVDRCQHRPLHLWRHAVGRRVRRPGELVPMCAETRLDRSLGGRPRGATTIVEYLVAHGAKLDVRSKQNFTPLDIAMGKSSFGALPVPHDSTVELFRKLGAPEAKDLPPLPDAPKPGGRGRI
jgi:hypothetical protein